MKLVVHVMLILWFLGLALAIQGSRAPSPSTLDMGSSRQVLYGPVSAPSIAYQPIVNFNNTGSSPALSPSFVDPVAAPSIERHDAIPPINDSPPQEPYISPSSAPTPSVVRKRDGKPSATPPISVPGAEPPTSHSPTKEPGIPFTFAPPPSIVSERDGVPAAAPRSERPEPVPPVPPVPSVDHSPIRVPEPTSSALPTPLRAPIHVAAPPIKRPKPLRPVNHHPEFGISPVSNPPPSITWKKGAMPEIPRPVDISPIKEPDISPASTPPESSNWKRAEIPVAAPLNRRLDPQRPAHSSPIEAPSPYVTWKRDAMPFAAPPSKRLEPQPPMNHHPSTETATSPTVLSRSRRKHYPPAALKPDSSVIPSQSPVTSPTSDVSPTPSPSPEAPSGHSESMPFHAPKGDPSGTLSRSPKPLPVVQALPPPPPNTDCSSITCTEPYTNSPPGSPCACVLPIQVGLLLGIDLYTFFPLVSKLATEVSAGTFMKQSQVRIMGANAADQQLEKTIVLIDLVPLGKKFDGTTAFLTFERFWHKKVPIKSSIFGDCEVLYVHYPGLPPSPPLAPSDISIVDGGPYPGSGNNGRNVKPLGVYVQKRQNKDGLGGGVIAIIVLSATLAAILLSAAVWIFLFKQRDNVSQREPRRALPSSLTKSSAALGSTMGSGASSVLSSIGSSIAPYTGSAKTFSTSEIEKATDYYNPLTILGEGGFGRVYSGILEDGTKIAVKVLKRDDQQGSREFLAEIEMLSRLHHRNLVKLIGMCIEERNRCLVYELIPNGSVESHLHGIDKKTSPLDWAARIKIALGAARGLAYLHEDSSPRVIHRDFKSSNILLENDFTPKVSDFGLARTAMDEENRHISTRVMGTFGYVAPEYAMTGHLLVKSDVYSYGVVLLELLSGKKPVDMSQAPGQENLVAWARPLLNSKEGLEALVDPSLGSDVPYDSISKVAAIASMCVQPEVSNRPFMGEVVQALKLVCNQCEEAYEDSRTSECEDMSIDMEGSISSASSEQLSEHLHRQFSHSTFEHRSDPEHRLSVSDILSTSTRFGRPEPGSFRRNSSSGPMRTGGSKQFFQKVRRLYGGSVSEHGSMSKFWPGSR